jgi:hypothetical protein
MKGGNHEKDYSVHSGISTIGTCKRDLNLYNLILYL